MHAKRLRSTLAKGSALQVSSILSDAYLDIFECQIEDATTVESDTSTFGCINTGM